MKQPLYGYCALTADGLHIGHINFLKKCKSKCRHLIVGIMTDSCVEAYKERRPVMNQNDRAKLIKSIGFVYKTMFQDFYNFPSFVMSLKEFYDGNFIIFDSEEHKRKGADIIFPRTPFISSTILRESNESLDYSQCPL